MILISVVIPCYEMHGFGLNFLNQSLAILEKQTFKDFEVIVSDHSVDESIKGLCASWSKCLDIKYFKFEEKRGNSSANVNNCIRKSQGKFIKVLCQDDFLFNTESLLNTYEILNKNPNAKWLVSKYIHSNDGINYYREHIPEWNDNIHFHNTIGTHSCLSFINEGSIFFDENLIWFMDCEFYKRIKEKYGLPLILNEITIVNRTWSGSVTNSIINKELVNRETQYILLKYKNRS